MMDLPKSPIEFACRHCRAPIGEKCTTVPLATSHYVQVLNYFHSVRWRDLNIARNDRAKFNDYQQKYGSQKV